MSVSFPETPNGLRVGGRTFCRPLHPDLHRSHYTESPAVTGNVFPDAPSLFWTRAKTPRPLRHLGRLRPKTGLSATTDTLPNPGKRLSSLVGCRPGTTQLRLAAPLLHQREGTSRVAHSTGPLAGPLQGRRAAGFVPAPEGAGSRRRGPVGAQRDVEGRVSRGLTPSEETRPNLPIDTEERSKWVWRSEEGACRRRWVDQRGI